MTFAVEAGPAHGRLTLNADGTFTYTPDRDFSGRYVYDDFWKYYGSDSFTYLAMHDKGAWTVGIVVVDVTPVDDTPVAAGQSCAHGRRGLHAHDRRPGGVTARHAERADRLGRRGAFL